MSSEQTGHSTQNHNAPDVIEVVREILHKSTVHPPSVDFSGNIDSLVKHTKLNEAKKHEEAYRLYASYITELQSMHTSTAINITYLRRERLRLALDELHLDSKKHEALWNKYSQLLDDMYETRFHSKERPRDTQLNRYNRVIFNAILDNTELQILQAIFD